MAALLNRRFSVTSPIRVNVEPRSRVLKCGRGAFGAFLLPLAILLSAGCASERTATARRNAPPTPDTAAARETAPLRDAVAAPAAPPTPDSFSAPLGDVGST